MNNFYAQINNQNTCISIIINPTENDKKKKKLIPIELLGKIYNFDTLEWEENDFILSPFPFPEIAEDKIIQPTQLDRIENMLNILIQHLNIL